MSEEERGADGTGLRARLGTLPMWAAAVWLALCGGAGVAVLVAQTMKPAAAAAGKTTAGKATPARVFWSTLTLPTYDEDLPDVNPPFDLFVTRFTYPYTQRQNLTDRRAPQTWRTVVLENEYLSCIILPDLGGHLYTCRDRINGASLFYANPSIKKANVAFRGAWTALGVEFNFPISHSWVTVSPVDVATTTHPDGSASVIVGNVDRVYGGQWRVELQLRPGRARLEQHTTLYNRSERRHRFYWWTNAAVEVWDDSRLHYPQAFTASHGFTDVDTWPINRAGVDLSVVGNHKSGPVSQFSHGSREPFMAVYHPHTNAGIVHYSSPLDLPAKKVWSWSSDADGLDWRKALSDDNSAYVEIQAGLFRNQETFAFLEPQASLQFSEYWLPVREIGGITRATPDAVLNLTRDDKTGALRAGLNVLRALPRAHVTVSCGTDTASAASATIATSGASAASATIADERVDLTPRVVYTRAWPSAPRDAACRFELADAKGEVVLAHTEGRYDLLPADQMKVGPQQNPTAPPPDKRADGDWIELGTRQELDGKLLIAWDTYQRGLQAYPASAGLLKASGRLALALGRDREAIEPLSKALTHTSNDSEAHYYLGLAQAEAGDTANARRHFELAQQFDPYRTPARFELARLIAREGTGYERGAAGRQSASASPAIAPATAARARAGDSVAAADAARLAAWNEALGILSAAVHDAPAASRLGAAEVTLLRLVGRSDEARVRWRHWTAIDPINAWLRVEGIRLGTITGSGERDVWLHLAGDADRVIGVAADYMAFGWYDDALTLLSRKYPEGEGVFAEPGAPSPNRHPLVAYYRGYCRRQMGQANAAAAAAADDELASSLPTTYVFPHRHETMAVLREALKARPEDATARFLLGSLYLSGGMVTEAVSEWEAVRRSRPQTPGLHRNLGLTLLQALDQPEQAATVLSEGITHDAGNLDLYLTLDQALSLTNATADARASALMRYPSMDKAPAPLVFKAALALAEAGRFDDAERLFANRFFPREELGTNVRQVYIEVRLLRARAAGAARCDEATAIANSLASPTPGLAFTGDGLGPFVDNPRVHYELGKIATACDDRARGAAQFEQALAAVTRVTGATGATGGGPADLVFAHRAAVALGKGDALSARLQQAARDAASRAAAAGASNLTGPQALSSGLLMMEAGTDAAAARALLTQALRAPERGLSHYMARQALASQGR